MPAKEKEPVTKFTRQRGGQHKQTIETDFDGKSVARTGMLGKAVKTMSSQWESPITIYITRDTLTTS